MDARYVIGAGLIENLLSRRLQATRQKTKKVGAYIFLTGLLATLGTVAAPRPNVLFIMPDDLSYNDYSFYNPRGPRTPHVDTLGKESVRLTDFHVSPTCSPSRSAFMTGRYTDDTGAWHTVLGREFLWADEVTMADVFKANGYSTAIFGKWHLGESYPFRPQDRGFEHTVIIHGGGIDQQPDHWGNRNSAPCTLYVDDQPIPLTEANASLPEKKGVFASNFFTTQTIDYMKRTVAAGKPFFAYVPYNVSHGPQDLPPDARPGVSPKVATIENMDKNIGRILAFLDQSGLADNTILVLVLGDNGERNNLYRGAKGSEYEAGHRVPCFIRWKAGGIGGSSATSAEVHDLLGNLDLLPTLMDLVGLHDVGNRSPKVPIQGKSFKALLSSSDPKVHAAFSDRTMVIDNQREDDLIKYKQASIMRNVVNADGTTAHEWRLLFASDAKPPELYDAKADPHEKTDLSGNPEHASLIASLKASYETWWKTASTHAGDYARPVLGTPAEPDLCLFSHDWHTGGALPPWNQDMVARGFVCNGFHSVAFGLPGDYTFDLRRWPKELAGETTVTSSLAESIRVGGVDRDGQYKRTKGQALPIASARLRIWNGDHTYCDEKQSVDPASDGPVFTVKALPAGPAMVQTWFYDAAGKEICGAYYVYTSRLLTAAK